MEPEEVLGDSLIPVINRLQDIFNQVWVGAERGKERETARCRCCLGGDQGLLHPCRRALKEDDGV